VEEFLVVLHLLRHLIASLFQPAEVGIETIKLGLKQAKLQFYGQQIFEIRLFALHDSTLGA